MNEAPLVCWIVVNSVPYHEARVKAAVEARRLRLCLIQITEVDSFRVLQTSTNSEYFNRYTLFPGVAWDQIDGRAMARKLELELDRLRPSVVCINGWSCGGAVAAVKWATANGVPVIVMSESTAHDAPRHWWAEQVKRLILASCSAALVGGELHRQYLKDLGVAEEVIFTGYDAVDNEHFRKGSSRARQQASDLREALGLPARYFFACSRFTKKKNLSRLLQGYARYRRLHGASAWKLVVAGDGELKSELLLARDEMELQGSVDFVGAKSYAELPAYYGLASCFVHASTTEQWGLVVNEAMAAGLPVLVSNRCGCARDLVEEGHNGYLFDPYDPESLAGAMYTIAAGRSDQAAMGAASREIVSRWSPENFAENLARAAEKALQAESPRPGLVDRGLLQVLSTR
jgi:glycosyltransferase involved in cell wall biosynthesis